VVFIPYSCFPPAFCVSSEKTSLYHFIYFKMSNNPFQSDREHPRSGFPSQSQIYQYKRNLIVLERCGSVGISQCKSFYDYESLKRRASRCRVFIADFQSQFPYFNLSGYTFTPPFSNEEMQLNLFNCGA